MSLNLKKAILSYRQIRDAKKEAKKEFEEDWKPRTDMMDKLKGFFLDHLNKEGSNSIKTDDGTVHKITKTSYVVEDLEGLWAYLTMTNEHALIKITMNKENVEQFKEDNNGELPPGVVVKQFIDIGVRAPAKKSAK